MSVSVTVAAKGTNAATTASPTTLFLSESLIALFLRFTAQVQTLQIVMSMAIHLKQETLSSGQLLAPGPAGGWYVETILWDGDVPGMGGFPRSYTQDMDS